MSTTTRFGMKFNGLRTRITALVISFCLLTGIIFIFSVNYAHRAYYEELRQRQGLAFTQNVAAMYPDLADFRSINREEVERRFAQMLLFEPSSAIYLIDNQGRVQAGYTKQRSIDGIGVISLEPIA